MKKTLSLLLAGVMCLSLTACGGRNNAQPSETAAASASAQTGPADVSAAGTDGADRSDAAGQPEASEKGTKCLVLYFSAANTADADAVSGATPCVDGCGATEYLAQQIHAEVGGDLVKITPETDYPLAYNDTLDAAKAERDNDARPAFLSLDVNPEAYDVIFVGYPIWWYTLPMVMYTFFDTYDFSGKTLIPFNTHAGSRDGGTYAEIAAFEPDATVLDGLAIAGSSVGSETESAVGDWLAGLAY